MSKDKERLRKKMHKLYRWARNHGYGYVDMCIVGPEPTDPRWYASVTVGDSIDTTGKVSVYQFYDEGSDDE